MDSLRPEAFLDSPATNQTLEVPLEKGTVVIETIQPESEGSLRKKLEAKQIAVIDSANTENAQIDSLAIAPAKTKKFRTDPLTDQEKALLDSMFYKKGYISNAYTLALNNARNLKNSFDVKMSQVDGQVREFRRYEIAWYQTYSQAIACFVMFLIGAPLGAIIKKGGLGMPVLISILFFILFYMLTITGEKWAKEGVTDPLFGTIFSNLCLLPFGLFFLRQARKDARLFESDFYAGIQRKLVNFLPRKRSI
jgi:lipopolysaccharide export system permease protein